MGGSNLLYSLMALVGACIIVVFSHIIDNYLCKHPGKSRPANGKTPLVLGIGNGIGVGMFGEFIRKGGVQASYSFLCFIIPLIPLGCYDRCISNYKSESYKRQVTTYQMAGSQPWRFLEVLSIYCRYWGGVAEVEYSDDPGTEMIRKGRPWPPAPQN